MLPIYKYANIHSYAGQGKTLSKQLKMKPFKSTDRNYRFHSTYSDGFSVTMG